MNGPVKVVVGGFELLTSGTAISIGFQTVDIYPVDAIFSIRISYKAIPSPSDANIEIDNTSTQHQAQIIATNFNQPTGIASNAPIHIANWNGRKMYFMFSCHLMGTPDAGTRLTTYSIYLGEASTV
jgi:uncharacterized protein DUF6864